MKVNVFSAPFSLFKGSVELAEQITSKSPVAVQGSKLSLNYSRDHSIQEGLDHIVSFNIIPPVITKVLLNRYKYTV